jgi:hypothetical protein
MMAKDTGSSNLIRVHILDLLQNHTVSGTGDFHMQLKHNMPGKIGKILRIFLMPKDIGPPASLS